MVFDYYHRLSRSRKAVYRRSDAIESIALNGQGGYADCIRRIRTALEAEQRVATRRASLELLQGLVRELEVPPVGLRVLSVRPSHNWGELHGLYEPAEDRRQARITVWMRTARHRRVVAFRTYLRTVLHEFCHHLDYERLGLAESFHTEGFFKRESSLFKQLLEDSGGQPGA